MRRQVTVGWAWTIGVAVVVAVALGIILRMVATPPPGEDPVQWDTVDVRPGKMPGGVF